MRYLYIFLLLNTLLSVPLLASEQESYTKLAVHKTWLKLLHMQTLNEPSKITSTDFFLAKKGFNDAGAELHATIDILDIQSKKTRLQTMCKFPARYLWLSRKLNRDDIQQDLKSCTKLQRWVADNDEVSLILVSGYLGNPASTFGHALLKLQSSKLSKQSILMDTAINYGAITPNKEPTLQYIYKGITGGYKATFLDKYYYTQELMYSRLESRDMWAYTLNLDDYKTRLLMYHVWELIGKKFDYYFLDENCAYQLADVLGLVLDEPMVEETPWYVPVEALYRLEALDEQYRAEGRDGLIKSVLFLPSNQRKLNEQLAQLSPKELKVMRMLMDETKHVQLANVLKHLSISEQMSVLDAALSYYNYQYVKSGLKPSEQDKALKRNILLARFKLPAAQDEGVRFVALPSPTKGFAPKLFGIGLTYDDTQKGYADLHWAAYSQSSTGQNNLNGDELVVLDTSIGVGGQQNDIFLQSLDLIRIRKLNNNQMLVKNHDWAWQMRLGVDGIAAQGKMKYDAVVRFGAGKTWATHSSWALTGMLDVSLHSLSPSIRLRPHILLYSDLGKVKSLWYVGAENTMSTGDVRQVWGGELQYRLAPQSSVVFTYKHEKITQATLEWRWFK